MFLSNWKKMKIIFVFVWLSFLLNEVCCFNSIELLGVYVRWSNLGSKTDFFLTSSLANGIDPSDAWLAIGINNNTLMDFANIVVCRNSPILKEVSYYKAIPSRDLVRMDSNDTKIGLSNTRVQYLDGNFSCSFTRENFQNVSGYHQVDTVSAYYFLVAFGSGLNII